MTYFNLPSQMKALGNKSSLIKSKICEEELLKLINILGRIEYSEPRKFSVVHKPLPLVRDDDVLVSKQILAIREDVLLKVNP